VKNTAILLIRAMNTLRNYEGQPLA